MTRQSADYLTNDYEYTWGQSLASFDWPVSTGIEDVHDRCLKQQLVNSMNEKETTKIPTFPVFQPPSCHLVEGHANHRLVFGILSWFRSFVVNIITTNIPL